MLEYDYKPIIFTFMNNLLLRKKSEGIKVNEYLDTERVILAGTLISGRCPPYVHTSKNGDSRKPLLYLCPS